MDDRSGVPGPGNLRHAEKSRKSTCLFADIVAKAALDTYAKVVPDALQSSFKVNRTVFSAFLLFDSSAPEDLCACSTSDRGFPLHVVSLGVGTKFMQQKDVKVDTDGKKVRDCHAEVLARRAFRVFLLKEMLKKGDSKFLEVCQPGKFRLRPKFRVVMYTSSAPCGNAVLKRWIKGRPRKHDGQTWEFRPFAYPNPVHEKILIQSLHQGQIAPLVKCDTAFPGATDPLKRKPPVISCDKQGRVAPGTAQFGTGFGKILSCSDKIALWNVLGVQGCAVMAVLDNPIYISVVVVGRKFSEPHLRRALCCRLQDFKPSCFPEISSSANCFRLNHPAMLCTAVKFDNGTLTQTTNAVFNEKSCVSWTLGDSQVDVIDGTKGITFSSSHTPQVSKAKLAELLCLVEQVPTKSYQELKASHHCCTYKRVKQSLQRLKMFEFLNDETYRPKKKKKFATKETP